MRKPVLLIFANACILIAIFALLTQSLFLIQRVARVGAVQGMVEVQHDGKGPFLPLTVEMTVEMGDVVRTGPSGSAELGWVNGTRWKLLSNGEIIIREANFSNDGKYEHSRLQLNQGKLMVRVARALSKDSRFEVETPTAIATTQGQVFSIELQSGLTSVDVLKGSVDITPSQGGSEIVATPLKRVVETTKGWNFVPAKREDELCSEPDFIKPRLKATVRPLDAEHVLLNGETEAGSRVLVDGQRIPVLATGVFVSRLKRSPGTTSWKIECVDRYGQRTVVQAGTETA
jgi:hypothetical protein